MTDLESQIKTLQQLNLFRRSEMKNLNQIENQNRGLIRYYMGWKWEMPEKERKQLNTRAEAIWDEMMGWLPRNIESLTLQDMMLVERVPSGKLSQEDTDLLNRLWPKMSSDVMLAGIKNRLMNDYDKQMRKLAETFPVYGWVKQVKGFGVGNLAYIMADAGTDLTNYSCPSKLWRRFGMGAINGERQRRTTDVELAKLHGYNPRRAAVGYQLGQCLVFAKSQPYKEIFDKEKDRQLTTVDKMTPGHAVKKARRKIIREALKDLWVNWRAYA